MTISTKLWAITLIVIALTLGLYSSVFADPGDYDVEGRTIILDGDDDTSIGATTDDIITFDVSGTTIVTLSTTTLTVGVNTFQLNPSTNPSILGADADGVLTISSNSSTTGGNIRLFGNTHSTQAYDFEYRTNTTVKFDFDDSSNIFSYAPGIALIVGSSNQDEPVSGITPKFQFLGTDNNTSWATMGRWSADPRGPSLVFIKGRDPNISGIDSVADGDILGIQRWYAEDGANFPTPAATFFAVVDDSTPSDGSIGTSFIFNVDNGAGGGLSTILKLKPKGTLEITNNDTDGDALALALQNEQSVGSDNDNLELRFEMQDNDGGVIDFVGSLEYLWRSAGAGSEDSTGRVYYRRSGAQELALDFGTIDSSGNRAFKVNPSSLDNDFIVNTSGGVAFDITGNTGIANFNANAVNNIGSVNTDIDSDDFDLDQNLYQTIQHEIIQPIGAEMYTESNAANASSETNSTGSWTTNVDALLSSDNTIFYDGSYSIKMQATGNNGRTNWGFSVTSGYEYHISFWLYVTINNARLGIYESPTSVGSLFNFGDESGTVVAESVWKYYSGVVTAHETGTRYVRFEEYSPSDNTILYIDDFNIEQVSTVEIGDLEVDGNIRLQQGDLRLDEDGSNIWFGEYGNAAIYYTDDLDALVIDVTTGDLDVESDNVTMNANQVAFNVDTHLNMDDSDIVNNFYSYDEVSTLAGSESVSQYFSTTDGMNFYTVWVLTVDQGNVNGASFKHGWVGGFNNGGSLTSALSGTYASGGTEAADIGITLFAVDSDTLRVTITNNGSDPWATTAVYYEARATRTAPLLD